MFKKKEKKTETTKKVVKKVKYDYTQAIEKSGSVNKLWSGKMMNDLVKTASKYDVTFGLYMDDLKSCNRENLCLVSVLNKTSKIIAFECADKLPRARPSSLVIRLEVPSIKKAKSRKKLIEASEPIVNEFCRLIHEHGYYEWAVTLRKDGFDLALSKIKK